MRFLLYDATFVERVRFAGPKEKGSTVTEVTATDDMLVFEVQGWDKLWSMTSRLEIPLENVLDVRPADDSVEGVRVLGTCVPGIITAGTFLQEGDWVFWDVHDPRKAIAVDLQDDRYAKLIVEVADPLETISAIKHALFRDRFQRV